MDRSNPGQPSQHFSAHRADLRLSGNAGAARDSHDRSLIDYSTPHTIGPAIKYFPSGLNEQGISSQFELSFIVSRLSSRPLGTSTSRTDPPSALTSRSDPSSLNFIGSLLFVEAFTAT